MQNCEPSATFCVGLWFRVGWSGSLSVGVFWGAGPVSVLLKTLVGQTPPPTTKTSPQRENPITPDRRALNTADLFAPSTATSSVPKSRCTPRACASFSRVSVMGVVWW